MLALSEYIMAEPHPLATVHAAIFDFCRDREDLCVFGAQAVSQHTGVPRMTQEVDIMAEHPEAVADELVAHLRARFPHEFSPRVRVIRRHGRVLGYRVYQRRSEDRGGNRHLADIRILDVPRDALACAGGIRYTGAELTLAMELHASVVRSNPIKRDQDRVDARRLLAAMPVDYGRAARVPVGRSRSAGRGPGRLRTPPCRIRTGTAAGRGRLLLTEGL